MPNTQALESWQAQIKDQKDFAFIQKIYDRFPKAEVYLVGGAVRDLILGRSTKDFDFVVRQVEPKDLEDILDSSGKVDFVGKHFGIYRLVPTDTQLDEAIEIALPRTENAFGTGGYNDVRVKSDPELPIEEDLKRRDFTINAMAWLWDAQQLVDPFNGLKDIEDKVVRTVGQPADRFQEDASRMLRAVRFSVQLDFEISDLTKTGMTANAELITKIAPERINTELTKMIMTDRAADAIRMLEETGVLEHIIPEISQSKGVGQNKNHIHDVFDHLINTLDAAAKRDMPLTTRLAALFHDIGKPATKRGQGYNSTFYDHDAVGAKMVRKILKRLAYSSEIINKVSHLIRYHMFYYNIGEITDAGVRRFIRRVGAEHIEDLINLRIADRLGMGRPKAKPYKLVELEKRIKEVQLDPITTAMLAIDGHRVMELAEIKPSRRIGLLMNALLNEVLEDPSKNTVEYLEQKLEEYNKMSDDELKKYSPDIEHYEEERKKELHKK